MDEILSVEIADGRTISVPLSGSLVCFTRHNQNVIIGPIMAQRISWILIHRTRERLHPKIKRAFAKIETAMALVVVKGVQF